MSFTAALGRTLGAEAIIGFDRVLFGLFTEFQTLAETLQRQIYLSPDALPPGGLVAGHFAYSTLKRRAGPGQLITLMREPISRIFSHRLYWRSHDDTDLAQWGAWAHRVRQSFRPLAEFLREPSLAAQLDNLAARMLLWPHPLVPDGDFIDRRHGDRLLDEARRRLSDFAFVGVIEDPNLSGRLAEWFQRPFALDRINETTGMPAPARGSLADELTEEAVDLLDDRTWLDTALWRDVVRCSLADRPIEQVRERALLRSASRHAQLMSGYSPGGADEARRE
jgi:hypothetical protein